MSILYAAGVALAVIAGLALWVWVLRANKTALERELDAALREAESGRQVIGGTEAIQEEVKTLRVRHAAERQVALASPVRDGLDNDG